MARLGGYRSVSEPPIGYDGHGAPAAAGGNLKWA